MDRITRKELKTDRFAAEVGHTVEFLSEHRAQMKRYAPILAGVLVVALGIYLFVRYQRSVRQEELRAVFHILEAQVTPTPSDAGALTFPNQEAKSKAVNKALTDLAARRSGSDEGAIAKYFLASAATDQGRLAEAERLFREVTDFRCEEYRSLARFSLAQVYTSQGKTQEAEKLLRSLVDEPTMMVSKEQATIALARLLAKSKPDEARKLLEPLRTERSAVSKAALQVLGELNAR